MFVSKSKNSEAIKIRASFHVRMQNYNEKENHNEIPKDAFAEIINVDWARMLFSLLAYNQTPKDLVYEPTVDQDECLKKDSRYSTTIFHLESKFRKHNIKKFTTSHGNFASSSNSGVFHSLFRSKRSLPRVHKRLKSDVISKEAVFYTFKKFKYNAENGRMTKQHHLSIHHCEMMGLILKFHQSLEISSIASRPKEPELPDSESSVGRDATGN